MYPKILKMGFKFNDLSLYHQFFLFDTSHFFSL